MSLTRLEPVGCGTSSLSLISLSSKSGPIPVNYERLTQKPQKALEAIDEFVGRSTFKHYFYSIECRATELDRRIGATIISFERLEDFDNCRALTNMNLSLQLEFDRLT